MSKNTKKSSPVEVSRAAEVSAAVPVAPEVTSTTAVSESVNAAAPVPTLPLRSCHFGLADGGASLSLAKMQAGDGWTGTTVNNLVVDVTCTGTRANGNKQCKVFTLFVGGAQVVAGSTDKPRAALVSPEVKRALGLEILTTGRGGDGSSSAPRFVSWGAAEVAAAVERATSAIESHRAALAAALERYGKLTGLEVSTSTAAALAAPLSEFVGYDTAAAVEAVTARVAAAAAEAEAERAKRAEAAAAAREKRAAAAAAAAPQDSAARAAYVAAFLSSLGVDAAAAAAAVAALGAAPTETK